MNPFLSQAYAEIAHRGVDRPSLVVILYLNIAINLVIRTWVNWS